MEYNLEKMHPNNKARGESLQARLGSLVTTLSLSLPAGGRAIDARRARGQCSCSAAHALCRLAAAHLLGPPAAAPAARAAHISAARAAAPAASARGAGEQPKETST